MICQWVRLSKSYIVLYNFQLYIVTDDLVGLLEQRIEVFKLESSEIRCIDLVGDDENYTINNFY